MTWISWTLAGLSVAGGGLALFFWLVLRFRNRQFDHVQTSRNAYRFEYHRLLGQLAQQRQDAKDKQDALKARTQALEAGAMAQIESLRSSNERLRKWQRRVINGHPEADLHLRLYVGEMDPNTCLLAERLKQDNNEAEEGR